MSMWIMENIFWVQNVTRNLISFFYKLHRLFYFLQGKFLSENVSQGIIMGNQTLVIQNVKVSQVSIAVF